MKFILKYSDYAVAILMVSVVAMLIIPLPTMLLDILFTLNIAGAMIILLVSTYTLEPLEFSVFPTLLLITTLFRLALNVSAARLILLNAFAGEVIRAFGGFVVGGNVIVGLIIFAILIVIQYVVITSGAGRVAEVAARFTLDAMPGKQMAIDADLNAGLVSEDDARKRRRNIEREADFYGAMDGAAKFVKGDAIAAIMIVLINLIGGLLVGVLRKGMDISTAIETYSILSVGDGLVTQIPALLISTATGIVVTRAASEANLGRDVAEQLISQPRALGIAAGVLAVFAFIPGLPTIPFLALAVGIGLLAYAVAGFQRSVTEEEERQRIKAELPTPESVVSLLPLDPMEIEIGYGLIPLVDSDQGGDLLDRITMVRKQVALDLGIVIPPIRIRDNMQLAPSEYRFKIKGVDISKGEIRIDSYLAMNPGTVETEIEGTPTLEPAFGLPALWIAESQREEAEIAGYTVVDPSSILITHLTEVVKNHAPELLSRQDVQLLVDGVGEKYPAAISNLIPDVMTLGDIQKVLQNLLRERVSIRDMVTILETLSDKGRITKDHELLTEYVRQALARAICRSHCTPEQTLQVITLDPQLERAITDAIHRTEEGAFLALEPEIAQKILTKLSSEMERVSSAGIFPIVLCSAQVRLHFKKLSEHISPKLVVLSYNEVVPDIRVEPVGMVTLTDES